MFWAVFQVLCVEVMWYAEVCLYYIQSILVFFICRSIAGNLIANAGYIKLYYSIISIYIYSYDLPTLLHFQTAHNLRVMQKSSSVSVKVVKFCPYELFP